jgi:uncharacterized protein
MRILTLSEDKAGTLTQCRGVADYLSDDVHSRIVPVGSHWRRFGFRMAQAFEREPRLIISCGRRAERPALRAKQRHSGRPMLVHLQRPQIDPASFDFAFVSIHDWELDFDGRPNFHKMVGVPNQITAERLDDARAGALDRFGAMGGPYAVFLVGGSNGAYVFDAQACRRIVSTVERLRHDGWCVLVSTSRRSDPGMQADLMACAGKQVYVWDRRSPNPLIEFFSIANAFLVTKDSVTMPCEAASTGKPVYILDLPDGPDPKRAKFELFHRHLRDDMRLSRAFAGRLDPYEYVPLQEAKRLADLVGAALERRDEG